MENSEKQMCSGYKMNSDQYASNSVFRKLMKLVVYHWCVWAYATSWPALLWPLSFTRLFSTSFFKAQ